MEFWGVEVKPGKALKVTVEEGTVIHLSQASFGEIKKGKGGETVPLFVEVDGNKYAIGHLSADNFPSQSYDLVFDQEFEISHNSKAGSIYFTGYSSEVPEEDDHHHFDSDDSEEEDVPELTAIENGKSEQKVEAAKKPEPKKDAKPMEVDEDDSDDSEDDDSEDDSVSDESDEEEEETPKVEVSKKRAAETPKNTPVQFKKAKGASPSGGKKGGPSTPHPGKQAGKSPSAQKSGGKHSHNKGKHGGKENDGDVGVTWYLISGHLELDEADMPNSGCRDLGCQSISVAEWALAAITFDDN
ncbi:hypothetical protein ACFE04_015347 [Oxalis oulophora]